MPSPKEMEYMNILRAVAEIPFPIGRKLLCDFLMGRRENASVARNRLEKLESFGSMHLFECHEIDAEISRMLHNGLLQAAQVRDRSFLKVLELTEKGRKELLHPSLHEKVVSSRMPAGLSRPGSSITPKERELFESLDFFLGRYNDLQKKAISSSGRKLLCIAGAGTGKTTVLTKRIEFLTRFRSVNPRKILAITFTRKARQEMASRLAHSAHARSVFIETFNSFCEKQLRYHSGIYYGRDVRLINTGERIRLLRRGLESAGHTIEAALAGYYTDAQRNSRTDEQLLFGFLNDCFTILDLFKTEGRHLEDFSWKGSGHGKVLGLVMPLCIFIRNEMARLGLRDYSDQLIDCLEFLKNHPHYMPRFEHILVDEYQDVNARQVELLGLLSPENLFCVGDPRQSIFGWRGSKIGYILDFKASHPDAEAIALTKNYRSSTQIVSFINAAVQPMGLPGLESVSGSAEDITLYNAADEQDEQDFIVEQIRKSVYSPKETFVLARTNRQLNQLSEKLKQEGISHVLRTEEQGKPAEPSEDDVVLATVHSIKGMEAESVIVMGCTPLNFPCRTPDHPVIDILKTDDYDKEEEERRVFYVALSRARKSLLLTYAGKSLTYFITPGMKRMVKGATSGGLGWKRAQLKPGRQPAAMGSPGIQARLRQWRSEKAGELGIPAYMVLHDSALQEIAELMPATEAELLDVRGIGRDKVRRFGNEIIILVNSLP